MKHKMLNLLLGASLSTLLIFVSILACACGGPSSPTSSSQAKTAPSPTSALATPTNTSTPSVTPTNTSTPSVTPTSTSAYTPTPTNTLTPTYTHTPPQGPTTIVTQDPNAPVLSVGEGGGPFIDTACRANSNNCSLLFSLAQNGQMITNWPNPISWTAQVIGPSVKLDKSGGTLTPGHDFDSVTVISIVDPCQFTLIIISAPSLKSTLQQGMVCDPGFAASMGGQQSNSGIFFNTLSPSLPGCSTNTVSGTLACTVTLSRTSTYQGPLLWFFYKPPFDKNYTGVDAQPSSGSLDFQSTTTFTLSFPCFSSNQNGYKVAIYWREDPNNDNSKGSSGISIEWLSVSC